MPPRIRTLKPEAFGHRKVGRLSDRAFRLWAFMLTQADDEGRLYADPDWLRAQCFGYQPNLKPSLVEAALEEIAGRGLIRIYVGGEGARVVDFPSWRDHQVIDRPTKSKLPPFQENLALSTSPRRALDEPSTSPRRRLEADRNGSERNGTEGSGGGSAEGGAETAPPLPAPARETIFKTPTRIQAALRESPVLGASPRAHRPAYWQAQLRAFGDRGVNFADEIRKAEAYLAARPGRIRDPCQFLHNWFKRAAADLPAAEDD